MEIKDMLTADVCNILAKMKLLGFKTIQKCAEHILNSSYLNASNELWMEVKRLKIRDDEHERLLLWWEAQQKHFVK